MLIPPPQLQNTDKLAKTHRNFDNFNVVLTKQCFHISWWRSFFKLYLMYACLFCVQWGLLWETICMWNWVIPLFIVSRQMNLWLRQESICLHFYVQTCEACFGLPQGVAMAWQWESRRSRQATRRRRSLPPAPALARSSYTPLVGAGCLGLHVNCAGLQSACFFVLVWFGFFTLSWQFPLVALSCLAWW